MYGDIPGGGSLAIIVVANTAPTTSQNQEAVGTFWLNPEPAGSGNLYYLAGFVAGVPQWELISSSAGSIVSVAGTANQITANTTAGAVTLSIPATFIAPGSIAATTSVTAPTGYFTTPVVVAAAASPQTANGRTVDVTFSGVSIAAGATQSFVIANTAVPASTSSFNLTMIGATTGAALNIQSVTNVAATSTTIVVENGTGATTSIANIRFIMEFLN